MLISRNWLQEYVDITSLSDKDLSHYLTDIGLEVEGVTVVPPLDDKVVVGKVIEASKHPNADSLKLCTVDVGEPEALTIVCGAPNARTGIYVCVATLGSVLPGNFKIKPTKIRGESSKGMMCSGKELEISDDQDGIIELGDAHKIGTPINQIYQSGDTVFEINITPNRGDCLGYIGVARDLSAKLKTPLIIPEVNHPKTDSSLSTKDFVAVEINHEETSQRFAALYIKDLPNCSSPQWMQKRLEASGMRPLNLIVDVTNYVMLEMNQPIHAYDERDVEGRKIIVRKGTIEDKLKTLDGSDLKIKTGDILICDSKSSPIGLAGIMGGANSEIKDDTKDIIVEVAEFDPGMIRKTSKRLGLHTEASHRFERIIDKNAIDQVAKRVGYLYLACCEELGAPLPKVAHDLIDIHPVPTELKKIALRVDRAKKVLGLATLSADACIQHLEALKFKLLDQKDERLLFEVPSFRPDITREIDLIEEVGRLEGFDKVPYELPRMSIKPNDENPYIDFSDNLKSFLAGSGLTEVILYPFVSNTQYEELLLTEEHPYYPSVTLANPLSEEFNKLQSSQIAPCLAATKRNRNHNYKGSRLFQIGRGYFDKSCASKLGSFQTLSGLMRHSHHMTAKAKSEEARIVERHFLTIVIDSPYHLPSWNESKTSAQFHDMKKICETTFKAFSVTDLKYKLIDPKELPMLHPKLSATIWKDDVYLGFLGQIHPLASKKLDLGFDDIPVVCEVEVESLFELAQAPSKIKTESFNFPAATRDLSLLVSDKTTHQDFEDALASFPRRKHITSMRLFDLYQGKNVEQGFKSMAYTLELRSPKQTLKDEQVDKEVTAFLTHLEETLQATQR